MAAVACNHFFSLLAIKKIINGVGVKIKVGIFVR